MKTKFAITNFTAAFLGAAALAGCTTPSATSSASDQHRQRHPAAEAPRGSAAMAGGMGMMGGGKGMMMSDADMKSMCEMHEQMMRAKTPDEQRAVMAEHMKKMPPEIRHRYMERMHSHMQMMQEYMKNQPPGR